MPAASALARAAGQSWGLRLTAFVPRSAEVFDPLLQRHRHQAAIAVVQTAGERAASFEGERDVIPRHLGPLEAAAPFELRKRAGSPVQVDQRRNTSLGTDLDGLGDERVVGGFVAMRDQRQDLARQRKAPGVRQHDEAHELVTDIRANQGFAEQVSGKLLSDDVRRFAVMPERTPLPDRRLIEDRRDAVDELVRPIDDAKVERFLRLPEHAPRSPRDVVVPPRVVGGDRENRPLLIFTIERVSRRHVRPSLDEGQNIGDPIAAHRVDDLVGMFDILVPFLEQPRRLHDPARDLVGLTVDPQTVQLGWTALDQRRDGERFRSRVGVYSGRHWHRQGRHDSGLTAGMWKTNRPDGVAPAATSPCAAWPSAPPGEISRARRSTPAPGGAPTPRCSRRRYTRRPLACAWTETPGGRARTADASQADSLSARRGTRPATENGRRCPGAGDG